MQAQLRIALGSSGEMVKIYVKNITKFQICGCKKVVIYIINCIFIFP